MANIYIFSEAKQSGKTAAIVNWLTKIQGAAGFLTPDILGRKKLYDIATGDYLDLEVDESCTDCTRMGECQYDNKALEYGRQLLLNAVDNWPRWLVIDDIGPLEMDRNEGWEPALGQVIKAHHEIDGDNDLLMVVNEPLLNEMIQHYRLHAAIVLDRKFFVR
ncbi:MAG: hypothetical protein JSS82_16345 [Bacteroidetes bacterium]|nr:hypothetical protein [Bacteroidota bacterium]